jgi:large repetitive protein
VKKHLIVVLLACSSVVSAAVPAAAATITLSAATRGWYRPTGVTNGTSATNNYISGDCRGAVCGVESDDMRNWFNFDLSAVSGTVISARLLLDIRPGGGADGYASTSSASETYTVFDVSPGNVGSLGTSSVAIHTDLGSGVTFATYIATSASLGTTASISLNAAGLAALQAAFGGAFAVGGAVTTLNGVADDEYVFGFSHITPNQTRLEITTQDAVPEPGTWLLFGTGVALLATRRMKQLLK